MLNVLYSCCNCTYICKINIVLVHVELVLYSCPSTRINSRPRARTLIDGRT